MSSERNKGNSEATPSPTKKQDKAPVAELKNGKVLFKQKPLSFEKQSETMQEIVRFRETLEQLVSQKASPLATFPEEHRPLIAKLAHESDKSLSVLAKNIHQELMPNADDDEEDIHALANSILPVSIVEDAITATLTRQNYGIDAPLGVKVPQALCVWRWETRQDFMHWLPKNSQDKALTRQAERVQARDTLRQAFNALPLEDREALLGSKGAAKGKELAQPNCTEIATGDQKPSPQKQGKKKAEDENQDQKAEPKPEKPKKAVDREKAAKEKERQEKKNARLEKERKEKEAQCKSKNLMANFFGKSKAQAKPKPSEAPKAGPSNQRSDFERVFKPFALQKDRVLAPINHFQQKKHRATIDLDDNVIVIEDEDNRDVVMSAPQLSKAELESMPTTKHIQTLLTSLPPSLEPKRLRKPHHLPPSLQWKVHVPLSVRGMMSRLSEAEVTGDDGAVRDILKTLEDRTTLPAKVFIFHEDTRPGYYGTWTKSSRIIGPRTPFAKDAVALDYTCDSGTEWEEEAQGEDVADADEDEEKDEEEEDSDLDDWLVDDDEVIEVTGSDRGFSPPPFLDLPPLPGPSGPKRKAEDGEKKLGKKRKVVVPLVAFAKGPCYETIVGEPSYEPFKPFAIQFFNDTPFPIDPFTFTSSCLEDYKASQQRPAQPLPPSTNDTTFVMPAIPARLAAPSDPSTTASGSSTSTAPRRTPAAKTPFPDAHLPFLFSKIEALQASSITSLVEAVYLDLREHKVKKNAIEGKVREVGEKCKEKKYWVLKPAFRSTPTESAAGPLPSSIS